MFIGIFFIGIRLHEFGQTRHASEMYVGQRNGLHESKQTKHVWIIYSGPTDPTNTLYDTNFRFFLRHGLPSSYHRCFSNSSVVIVLTTASWTTYAETIEHLNATCGDLHIAIRANRCYDMESARVVLKEQRHFMAHDDNLVFLNCGLLGPFLRLPVAPEHQFWAWSFTDLLDEHIKLSGLTINCGGKLGVRQAHVQSMLWATDATGLTAILDAGAIYDCGDQLKRSKGRDELINRYELGLSKAIMKAGWGIMALHSSASHFVWSNASSHPKGPRWWGPRWCRDVWNDHHLDTKVPLESAIFWKVSRQRPSSVQRYARIMDELKDSIAHVRMP